MNKILLLLLISIGTFSCKKEVKVDYCIISGKILNTTAKQLVIVKGRSKDNSIAVKLSEDGSFRDTLRIDAGEYSIFMGRFVPIYLEGGLDFSFTCNAKDVQNTLKFEGKGAGINNYLFLAENIQIDYGLDEETFKAKANEIKKSLLQSIASVNDVSDSFIQYSKNNIQYKYLMQLLSYKNRKDAAAISDDFLAELKSFDPTIEEDYLRGYPYKPLVKSYYANEAKKLAKQKAIPIYLANFEVVSSNSNDVIKNDLLYDAARNTALRNKGDLDVNAFLDAFNAVSTNDKHKAEIAKLCSAQAAVKVGASSPVFIDFENYKGGTTSLTDFIGKYVYIDVWATWCGPCKQEIPFLKEVEKKYHGKNIEFVSISVDKMKDHDKWKRMIKDKNMGGVQLLAKENADFIKSYLINAIPRFILIDTKGKIVNPEAPRPSDPKLIKLLDSLDL